MPCDTLYVSKTPASVLTERNVQGAPDLVVEVLSESTAGIDRSAKLKLYGKFGVREYWIIDPRGPTVEIYRTKKKRFEPAGKLKAPHVLTSPHLPGFSLPLRRLVE